VAGHVLALVLAALVTIAIFAAVVLLIWAAGRSAAKKTAAKKAATKAAPTAATTAVPTAATTTAPGGTPDTSTNTYGGLVVGADNRISTSKLLAVMWTGILVFLILGIVFESFGSPATFTKQIEAIDPVYLILLGGPFAAAVLAKGIVSQAVASGTTQKPAAATPSASDAFSDDDGNTSLVDTQYLIFNALAAVIVLGQFITAPTGGAPTVPGFLAGLTGASATTYVANKAINQTKNPPTISMVTPPTVRGGSAVVVIGSNFVMDSDTDNPSVFIAGIQADVVGDPTATNIAVTVPREAGVGQLAVTVTTASGLSVGGATVTVDADAIQVSSTDSNQKRPGSTLVLNGEGFFAAGDLTYRLKPKDAQVKAASVTLQPAASDPAASGIVCPPVTGTAANDQLSVTIPADTPAAAYQLLLQRQGISYLAPQTVTVTLARE
jgi:hypothetical protein